MQTILSTTNTGPVGTIIAVIQMGVLHRSPALCVRDVSLEEEIDAMRNLYLIGLAVIVLSTAASVSYASVLHEDVAYWYKDGNSILTQFNPSTDWLNQNTSRLLVMVQQTVYDVAQSKTILYRNGNGMIDGYLHSYSVTNLNVGDAMDLADMGLTTFAIDWQVAPTLVTTSRQTVPGWAVDSPTRPSWKWTSAVDPGILAGDTVGGFYAVSSVDNDGIVTAHTTHVGPLDPHNLTGQTTGPQLAPDAPSFLSLAAGLLGLGVWKRRRK